jgi:beta-glucanase (GH16 family)
MRRRDAATLALAAVLCIAMNATPSPGSPSGHSSGHTLLWSDEFDGPAGSPPDPDRWRHALGDGTADGNPGWGNSELEWYTDSTANVAHDGEGNLVITARHADGDRDCWYGTCLYTSARLLTRGLFEFQHGRIEARIKVPAGVGLWPAFWMLGTNIANVGWPESGEIDVMEHVGRKPYQVFGTIHGPGYSGGNAFGNTLDLDAPVADDYHVFAVDWAPGHIAWTVDGRLYHEATPADVSPNDWPFEHPFFLLLNLAVGGEFGGPVDPETDFPAAMVVDYIRVYGPVGAMPSASVTASE